MIAAPLVLLLAAAAPPPSLEPLAFLIGEWEATGSGSPGAGSGKATFTRELQGRLIVRRSFAEYPATATAPASRHDDLMVVYADEARLRADYYDSEGHVIRYGVAVPEPGETEFLSEARAGEPQYRLSYRLGPAGVLEGEFAIAGPATPGAFKTYLRWTSRRVAR